MENASKALIIAGAILLAILLISLGVIIVNSSNRMIDEGKSSMDGNAKKSFNAQFTSYEGTSNSAAQIRDLVSTINASNATRSVTPNKTKANNPEGAVYLAWGKDAGGTTLKSSTLKSASRYTVALEYSDYGVVWKVTVSETK